jgi:hypothetical protein
MDGTVLRLKGFIAMFKLNVDEALNGAKLLALKKSVGSDFAAWLVPCAGDRNVRRFAFAPSRG